MQELGRSLTISFRPSAISFQLHLTTLKPTPIWGCHSETHAKLGWAGIDHSEPYANLG